MTTEQTTNLLVLVACVVMPLVLETALWFFRPAVLARLAYVPLGRSRRIRLGPRARVALAGIEGGGGYRDVALGAVDLARLPGPHRFEINGCAIALEPGGKRAVFRLPFTPSWFRFGGAGCIRLRADGGEIVASAAAYPWLAATSLGFFVPIIALAMIDGAWPVVATMLVLFVMFNAVAALRFWQRWRGTARGIVVEIETHLAALDR